LRLAAASARAGASASASATPPEAPTPAPAPQQQVTAHRWSSYTRAGKQEVPLTTQFGGSSFSVGGALATEAYALCARRTERRDVHVAEAEEEEEEWERGRAC
jgi:hypothetical protein